MSKIRLHGTSSGYTEIVPKAAAASNTLTAPSTVGEIIAKDAAGAIGITSAKTNNINVGAAVTITASGINATGVGFTVASINEGPIGGRRNLIINGAMNVAQRGTSSILGGYQTVDRFRGDYGGEDEDPTQAQITLTSSDTGPWAKGFRNAFQITNGNQTSGAGAADYAEFVHKMEAQDIATSGWDYTSSSSYITLSFWIKSSVAQTYYTYLQTQDGTSQRYVFSMVLSANTWTKIIKTIPGDSNLQFDNNNSNGLIIAFTAFYGTDWTASGVSLDTWGAHSSATNTPDQTSTWWTTNDATFAITGVQLELGSVATPFEHRSYVDELARCQRYCWVSTYVSQAFLANGTSWNSDSVGGVIHLPVPMRADPTVTFSSGDDFQSSMIFNNTKTLSGGMSRPYSSAPPYSEFSWRGINSGAFSTGEGVILRYKDGQTGAAMTATAEL